MGILREISKLEIFSPHENSRMNWAFSLKWRSWPSSPSTFLKRVRCTSFESTTKMPPQKTTKTKNIHKKNHWFNVTKIQHKLWTTMGTHHYHHQLGNLQLEVPEAIGIDGCWPHLSTHLGRLEKSENGSNRGCDPVQGRWKKTRVI